VVAIFSCKLSTASSSLLEPGETVVECSGVDAGSEDIGDTRQHEGMHKGARSYDLNSKVGRRDQDPQAA